jgi:hypothetical protein
MIPTLYWMLECRTCRTRRVVLDSYLEFVGSDDPYPAPGAGLGGAPLPERYRCLRGCSGPMSAIGSLDSPDKDYVWLEHPYRREAMDEGQRTEWLQLIREAGLLDG